MGKKVNQTELAEFLGKTDVTIWQWQKEGLPIDQVNTRGLSNVYDTADVVEWMMRRAEKKVREESPRDALARAQTKLLERDLAEREGSLVAVAEIEPGFARIVVGARQRLLQIPGLMRGALDEAQTKLLQEHLHEALQELSRHDPSRGTTEEGRGELGASEEDRGGGVVGSESLPERSDPVPGAVPDLDHPVPAGAA